MSQRPKIVPTHSAGRVSSLVLPVHPADAGCFTQVCEFLTTINNVSHSDSPIHKWNTDNLTILFSSAIAAKECGYMLRGDWDEVNAVTIQKPDSTAIHNTVELLKLELGREPVEFCKTGECCYLLGKEQQIFMTKECSSKSLVFAELLMQALSGEMPIIPFDFPK